MRTLAGRGTRLGAALAVLLGALALAGCGGSEDDAGAKRLLDEAFRQPIGSAKVTLDVTIDARGIEELKDPIKVKLTGPYVGGEDGRIPSFDWTLSLSGGGQSISAGFLSTGENVFVNFQGTDYEVGARQVAAFNRQIAEVDRQQGDTSLRRFGIDPTTWLSEARTEGDEEVAGVETTHVSARLDVGRMLEDLNRLVDRAGGQVPGGPPPAKLTGEQRRAVEEVVGDPRFDVYVGKQDKKIRRLSADLDLTVPDDARERVNGLEGGTIQVSIVFAEVGQPQRIEGPASARPLSELSSQFGGLGALTGGVGPQNGTPPPSGGGPDDSGAPASPEAQAFERYSRCLNEADPSDRAQIERCSELLR